MSQTPEERHRQKERRLANNRRPFHASFKGQSALSSLHGELLASPEEWALPDGHYSGKKRTKPKFSLAAENQTRRDFAAAMSFHDDPWPSTERMLDVYQSRVLAEIPVFDPSDACAVQSVDWEEPELSLAASARRSEVLANLITKLENDSIR